MSTRTWQVRVFERSTCGCPEEMIQGAVTTITDEEMRDGLVPRAKVLELACQVLEKEMREIEEALCEVCGEPIRWVE